MTTLYIAGPMTGYPEFNYPAFRAAEEHLRAAGFGVLNPVDAENHNDTGKPQEWHWYMRHALRMVLDADGLALLPGWEDSRGATLEVHVAKALTLPVRLIGEWSS
jgi:nucleoside 2-deoxyribosyltransferase